MGKILVLAEKPSVGREIAKVLGCHQKGHGYFTGGQYIVTWALGHLVTLAEPEVYNQKYQTWKLEDLPMIPKKMELVIIKKTAKQYGIVRGLMKRADVRELVIATDAGREGELVARWIIDKVGFKKPIKRLWISSQTDRAIKEGFKNLKLGKNYFTLYISAQCRAEADWLVGLNITRALTCKYNAQLSAGRVQTPTLAMIVDRENQIKSFVPKDFWTIEAKTNGLTLRWQDRKSGQKRINELEKAKEIVAKVNEQKGKVIEVKKEKKRDLPPLAYDLTELQRDANRAFGYSAKQTLSIMQRLYENHKVLTYPRTDSRYITEDIVPTLLERLKSVAVGSYSTWVHALIKNKLNLTKRFVDNNKVSDHHAIIPTEQYVNLSNFSPEERKIYDLVIKRFLAILSKPFIYEETMIKIEVKGELFSTKGRIVKDQGWKAIYAEQYDLIAKNDDEKTADHLPEVNQGDVLPLHLTRAINGKTKPPTRYTEATLLSAMEHPEKFIENKALRQTIATTSGLGTPATRADIIEKLFNSFYMEKNGKEIVPTQKGIQLVELVPEDLRSPALTAKWEQQLALISKKQADAKIFINNMQDYVKKMIATIMISSTSYRHDNLTRVRCPDCGKFLLEVKGKKGKMHVCQDRECGYRKSISLITNARCPQCHKKMEMRGEGEKKTFYCVCGYREKLSQFNERKHQKKKAMNKREVQRYLKKQQTNAPLNTALADALAKLKNK